MTNKIKKSGFSLIEMVIYVSILSVISIFIVNMLISLTSTYRTVVALRSAENSGILAMERMSRDIRASTSINLGQSTLANSPGVLTLITTSGVISTTTKYYVDQGMLKVDVNGVYLGPLSLFNATVTNLVFRVIDSGVSQAVKVDMTVQGTTGTVTKTKTFHSTVILKGQ